MILICKNNVALNIIEAWKKIPEGENAAIIGSVVSDIPGKVKLQTFTGGTRLVSVPRGELLPRIC
jgi:hydrogenase expression/formation protein HypE